MRKKILWIEDGAFAEMSLMAAAVYVDGRYDFTIATNATEGIRQIMDNQFAAVIVDIRLPPGNDRNWIEIFNSRRGIASRLGLVILQSLLKSEKSSIKLQTPEWIRPEIFGVFTVESFRELEAELNDLKITTFRQKDELLSKNALLELIRELTESASDARNKS